VTATHRSRRHRWPRRGATAKGAKGRNRRDSFGDNTRDDGGYVMVLTALALIPLMLFAGFAVDIGAWFTRAAQLQRTADMAALAGVVWMPDFTKASQIATDTAAKNGFTSGGDITVAVSAVPGNPYRLRVSVTDSHADQFFSTLVLDQESITRAATAEFYTPIPLGSPTNYFGTGNLGPGGVPVENIWAAINGYCAGKESGDPALARYDNTYASGFQCNGTSPSGVISNPDYDANGYIYAIVMPAVPPASVNVQVYDGAYTSGGGGGDPDIAVGGTTANTTFRLRSTGSTFDPLANPVLQTTTMASGNTSWNGWQSVGTIANPCADCTYYLQVSTANETNSAVSNGYAVRTAAGGSFTPCSSIVGSTNPTYSTGCVRIHPFQKMSVYVNASSSVASFYLADVADKYAGKTMQVTLFDLGEGASNVEVLDPNGSPVTFNWTTPCSPPTPATNGCSGSGVVALNPAPNGAAQPFPNTSSTWRLNDRQVTLSISLPTNYASLYGSNTWWKIRYTAGSSVTDRTTWSARVLGSPVHLVGG
jgi:Flp pilus assembly protein TadG